MEKEKFVGISKVGEKGQIVICHLLITFFCQLFSLHFGPMQSNNFKKHFFKCLFVVQ